MSTTMLNGLMKYTFKAMKLVVVMVWKILKGSKNKSQHN